MLISYFAKLFANFFLNFPLFTQEIFLESSIHSKDICPNTYLLMTPLNLITPEIHLAAASCENYTFIF